MAMEAIGWVILGGMAGVGLAFVWFAWYFRNTFRRRAWKI